MTKTLRKKLTLPFSGMSETHNIVMVAAKAVAFKEAAPALVVEYQKQVVANAKAMANTFMERGINIISNGTENHLILV